MRLEIQNLENTTELVLCWPVLLGMGPALESGRYTSADSLTEIWFVFRLQAAAKWRWLLG